MRKDLTLTVDAWGNIIVAGPVAPGSSTTFVAKLDKAGRLLWHETLSHGDLFESSASSVPPPAPSDRQSVEPVMLDDRMLAISDDDIDAYQHRLGRQSRIARWLGAALAFAGLFMLGAAGGAAASSAHQAGLPRVALAHAGVEDAVARTMDSAVGELTPRIDAPSDSALAAAAPSVDVPTTTMPGATITASMLSPDDARALLASAAPEVQIQENVVELRAEVLALLEAGQADLAVGVGERFVMADSDNAFAYLCLGAALQDLGRGNDARAVYDACARGASRGDVSECMALGGRK
jgi:hypothetical protein